jgi:hypothetical protein
MAAFSFSSLEGVVASGLGRLEVGEAEEVEGDDVDVDVVVGVDAGVGTAE